MSNIKFCLISFLLSQSPNRMLLYLATQGLVCLLGCAGAENQSKEHLGAESNRPSL